MVKSVSIYIPGMPNGEEVEIPHLGVFTNGGVHEVEEDRVLQFEAAGFSFPEDGVLHIEPEEQTGKTILLTDRVEDLEPSTPVVEEPVAPEPAPEPVPEGGEI